MPRGWQYPALGKRWKSQSAAHGNLLFTVAYGEIDTVFAVRTDDGLVSGLYAVRNPAKLSHMEQETTLRR